MLRILSGCGISRFKIHLEFPKEIHPDKERALQRSERHPLLRFWNLPGLESFLCSEYSQLKRQIYIKTPS